MNPQVHNSVYYNYNLSVNGVKEEHGKDYAKDYLTDLIVSRSSMWLQSDHYILLAVICNIVSFFWIEPIQKKNGVLYMKNRKKGAILPIEWRIMNEWYIYPLKQVKVVQFLPVR